MNRELGEHNEIIQHNYNNLLVICQRSQFILHPQFSRQKMVRSSCALGHVPRASKYQSNLVPSALFP